jgi:hypothetical protein
LFIFRRSLIYDKIYMVKLKFNISRLAFVKTVCYQENAKSGTERPASSSPSISDGNNLQNCSTTLTRSLSWAW